MRYSTYCSVRFLTALSLFLIFILPFEGIAQSWKLYYKSHEMTGASHFQVHEIQPIPGSEDFAIVGEIKGPSPNYSAMAFVVRATKTGEIMEVFAIGEAQTNGSYGIKGSSLAVDDEGNYYVGGSYTTNLTGPTTSGGERTLTAMDAAGNIIWSKMQPDFNVESVLYNEADSSIITASGPVGNSDPTTDILVNRLDKDGKLRHAATFDTPTRDEALKIVAVEGGGYVVAGNYDLDNNPQPFLMRLNDTLGIEWSATYEHSAEAIRLEDIVAHPNGSIGIIGTKTASTGRKTALLFGVDENGDLLFTEYFFMSGAENLEGLAIAAFQSSGARTQSGFMLTGSYFAPGPEDQRSFVINTDTKGLMRWSRTYSHYDQFENMWNESLTSITYLPDNGQFIAAGHVERFDFNKNVAERGLTAVRAIVADGLIMDDNNCSSSIYVLQATDMLTKNTPAVTHSAGGGFQSFGYNTYQPHFTNSWCSLDPSEVQMESELEETVLKIRDPFRPQIRRVGQRRFQIIQQDEPMDKLNLQIWDLSGRVIHEMNVHGAEFQLNELPAGLYIVKMHDSNGNTSSQRIVLFE